MFRKVMFLMTLTLVVVLVSACGANFSLNLFTADETVSQSFTAPAGASHIVVQTFNGTVDVVTGSDPQAVKIDVTKRGGGNSQQAAEDDLKNVEVTMTQEGDTIRVVARRTDQRVDIGNSGASAELRVPNGTILDVRSSNGAVTTSGPVGDVKAETSTGRIDVRGALGQLDLTTSNGSINANGGSGLMQLETSNGPITVDADNVTVSGHTSNGPINVTGSLTGHNDLRTSNGSIVVTLPASAAFAVNADTSNGKVSSDFPVTSTDSGDTYLRGTVGSDPGTTLELHTSNGPISIRQSH